MSQTTDFSFFKLHIVNNILEVIHKSIDQFMQFDWDFGYLRLICHELGACTIEPNDRGACWSCKRNVCFSDRPNSCFNDTDLEVLTNYFSCFCKNCLKRACLTSLDDQRYIEIVLIIVISENFFQLCFLLLLLSSLFVIEVIQLLLFLINILNHVHYMFFHAIRAPLVESTPALLGSK